MIHPLSLLFLLLAVAPDEGPRREFVLVDEGRHLAVVREVQEDDRLGFNRHCLRQLRYPENQVKRSQCFPADEAAAALTRSRDLELFISLRDSQLAQALAALPGKGFVPPGPFGERQEAGLTFDWGGRRATLRIGANKKNRPALLLAVRGQPQAKTLLTLEDLPPANDPAVAVMDQLALHQVLLLEGQVLAVVLDHSWVNEGRRLHTSRVHFLPLRGAAKLFSRPLPVGPADPKSPAATPPAPEDPAPAAPTQEPKPKKTE